jgi:hypothetical protein
MVIFGFQRRSQLFYDQLMTPKTFYIVDGMTPVDVDARTILLTSLRREIWHQFSKTSCELRYLELDKSGTIVPQLPGLHIWAKTEGNVRAIKSSILFQ